jgi:uncharacterized protein (TIGR02996 family)
MGDESALLHAIDANPDDDTPRLVYADWLQENGDPERAEFIRIQIEWFRRRERNEETRKLLDRAKELLDANVGTWTKEIRPQGGTNRVKIEFERGLPARLTLINATVNEFATLTRLPALRWLILEGRCKLTPFVLALITDLRWLDVLWIWDAEVSAAALEVFQRLPPWVVFRFGSVAGGDEVLRAFHARRRERFEQLPPDERRAGAIRSLRMAHDIFPPHLGERVKALRLTHTSTTDDELGMLTAIPEVEEIQLVSGQVTTEGLRHLARFPNLRTVEIENCPIDSYQPLAACPKLESLRINWDEYTGAGLRKFLESLR